MALSFVYYNSAASTQAIVHTHFSAFLLKAFVSRVKRSMRIRIVRFWASSDS